MTQPQVWPMQAAYAAATGLLRRGLAVLGRPAPERVPLRLRVEDGLLLSALPRAVGVQAQRLAEVLRLDGSPFDRLEAKSGLLLLFFSARWLELVLDCYAALPWPELEAQTGICRQDGGDGAFLRRYTLCRCRVLAAREAAQPETLTGAKGLICLLAQGPQGRVDEIVRRYWRLAPQLRCVPKLAGAVGRAAVGWNFDMPIYKKFT